MFTFSKYIKSEKGTSIVIFALSLTIIMGLGALTIDTGMMLYDKNKISNAVDAAALAGAQELINNKSNAVNIANHYLSSNGVDPDDADIRLTDSDSRISVTATKNVNFTFARVLGLNTGNIEVKGTAECGSISGMYKGLRPFAIEQQSLNFGQTYVLKEGGGNGSNGNYGALALGGTGASTYEDNIVNGYNGHLKVGDYVSTEPGNMSGPTAHGINALISQCNHSPRCTKNSYDPDCPRIITVIMVESLNVNGRKDVKITGFARFFLEGVEGHGNKSTVTGAFIRTIANGDISSSQTDFGLKGIKLVK